MQVVNKHITSPYFRLELPLLNVLRKSITLMGYVRTHLLKSPLVNLWIVENKRTIPRLSNNTYFIFNSEQVVIAHACHGHTLQLLSGMSV